MGSVNGTDQTEGDAMAQAKTTTVTAGELAAGHVLYPHAGPVAHTVTAARTITRPSDYVVEVRTDRKVTLRYEPDDAVVVDA